MPLCLTTAEVAGLIDMRDALAAVEDAMRLIGREGTVNLPRQRMALPGGSLQVLAAAMPTLGVFGVRSYASARQGGAGFNRLELYATADRSLLAIMDCAPISLLRTGAATAIAAKYLARPGAATVGLIGTGRQAIVQLEALAAARTIRSVRVFSRDAARCARFAGDATARLGIPVEAAASGVAAVTGADLVVAATNSRTPVIEGAWLAPGAHVTGMGANGADRRELDDACVLAAGVVATDDVAQARAEAAELIDLAAARRLAWDGVVSLADIVQGHAVGRRSPDEITVFKSLGVAIEDVALGAIAYRRASERGIGRRVEL